MRKLRYRTGALAAALLMIFGLACLNYTKVGSLERHRAVAEERGWPSPSPGIAYAGMVLTATGAVLLGWNLGRRKGKTGEGDPTRQS